MYLFVKKAYRDRKENTDVLVRKALDKLKSSTSCRQDAYPAGEVLRTERGKPYFPDGKVIFSVSHSEDIWVCLMGVTEKDFSLGIDIQRIRDSRYEDLAERYFSREEKEQIRNTDPDEGRKEKFFAIWTAKEAWGKALGTGIGKSLLAKDTCKGCGSGAFVIRHIPIEDGYECACCVPEEWSEDEILIREI